MLEGYILGTLKIFSFAAIALNLVHPRQGKATRFVIGVVLISAIMLPIVDIIDENDRFLINDSFVQVRQYILQNAFLILQPFF